MANVVDFQAVDNLKITVILLSVFDDILMHKLVRGKKLQSKFLLKFSYKKYYQTSNDLS